MYRQGRGLMAESEMNFALLDKVIQNIVQAVASSKEQIFEISESTRQEAEKVKQEISKVVQEVDATIKKVDLLEGTSRQSRHRLAEVSRNFKTYTEDDIRNAYEVANEQQIQLHMERQKELNLREKRDDLHLRLRTLQKTLERAETLLSQLGVSLDYLAGNLSKVGAVLESAQSKQKLGLQLIQAQEEERKRVAREIHDGPAQSIANGIIRTEMVERLLQKEEMVKANQELKDVKEMLRDSLTEVRKIIFDLRPMVLDDLGLVPTLRKYIEQFMKRTGIVTELISFGKEARLPNALEVALFRLFQEALANVQKHARAKLVHVKIEFRLRSIFLIISDDGVGFEWPLKNNSKYTNESFGILGMQERVEWLEGKMDIDSKLGGGTKIMLTIPIREGMLS